MQESDTILCIEVNSEFKLNETEVLTQHKML
jgi:hypothetical protein